MSIRNDWAETLSAQEVFDHVVDHLKHQEESCVNGSTCVYRSADGSGLGACAVGALLDATEAVAVIAAGCNEGSGVHTLADRGLMPARLLPHLNLMQALQHIHDGANARPLPPLWVEQLAAEARHHGVAFDPEAFAAP